MLSHLTVSTFPNAKALPLWAAMEHGLFLAHDLSVDLHETGSSREQRALLAEGKIQIVQAAVDNALAMKSNGNDAIILMGGEGGMNKFMVQASIRTFADIADGTLLVDSPDTAYALLARKVLSQHGLQAEKDYTIVPVGNGAKRLARLLNDATATGAILNPPFSAQAEMQGLRCLGTLDDLFGPYQAGGAFALRTWCEENRQTVHRYIRAYLASLEWIRDTANAAAAVAILRERLTLSADIASRTLRELSVPATGFAMNARLDHAGLTNLIQLRNEMEKGDASLFELPRIVDETFYHEAIAPLPSTPALHSPE